MDLVFIAQLFPAIMAVVGTLKRAFTDKQRNYVNPIIAVVTGIVGAYTFGGQQEVVNLLLEGLAAAAVAIGAYKLPKIAGAKLGF